MSLQRVAQLAGVSTSTVSRVVNEHPSVAGDTVTAVRDAMQRLNFIPTSRVRRHHSRLELSVAGKPASVGFVVLGTTGANAAPAFEKLLRGVSSACTDNGMGLRIGFVSDLAHAPQWLLARQVDGLLLHGEQPAGLALERFGAGPAVWLMGNRRRPTWGDQVMPNNAAIGDLAAKYLIRRGHRRLAHLGVGGGAWSLRLRSFAFVHAAEDAGADARVLDASVETPSSDYWCADGLAAAADHLVNELMVNGRPSATGLFLAEDRLLPLVDRALQSRGVRIGAGGDVEIVSCNNERPHHAGLQSQPAVIDIHPEAIGRRGVEQLTWRMRNPDVSERVRTMVDPTLLEPAGGPATEIASVESRAASFAAN
jgi:LacI family transcriptional regulator